MNFRDITVLLLAGADFTVPVRKLGDQDTLGLYEATAGTYITSRNIIIMLLHTSRITVEIYVCSYTLY